MSHEGERIGQATPGPPQLSLKTENIMVE